ncbi:LLM class flavin-dependent oxidoreductase [Rhodococcus triatomae]|uniref:Luciferase-like monooxygenase n=1 Tax=Rhodococcus triatomae TaxID=300028 RepID=A0A1G8NS74_9NOCA|nr:LLM class flavin-dependent oxidoreductase [Rhodococcus triatomae]QNG20071.1 LLM class flavin-dependent oxidoreductase [Rhodococcus triatomae]QNG24013.1 LLM class flavin-dependent oxidoreductase [Rhodococcus triatomae]SDI82816.1 Luciferase-like monooxygenase [Rhodococcus triatomae]
MSRRPTLLHQCENRSGPARHRRPLYGLALAESVLVESMRKRRFDRVVRYVQRSGADFVVLGLEWLTPSGPAPTAALSTSLSAAALTAETDHLGIFVAPVPELDHPLNLARRLATLEPASRGRIGWLTGGRDRSWDSRDTPPALPALWWAHGDDDPVDICTADLAVLDRDTLTLHRNSIREDTLLLAVDSPDDEDVDGHVATVDDLGRPITEWPRRPRSRTAYRPSFHAGLQTRSPNFHRHDGLGN